MNLIPERGTRCACRLNGCKAHLGHGYGEGGNRNGALCTRDATCFLTITPAHPMWHEVARVPGYERATFQHVPVCDECRDCHAARRAATPGASAPGYQPKTGAACSCKPGAQRDNCPECEGTGERINFRAIRERAPEARLTEDERALMAHVTLWGSDGYPVNRLRSGWTWSYRGIKGPPKLFRTKEAAVASFEAFYDVLRDKKAGRL